MAKIVDPILPILFVLGYWAIILGTFGGPGMYIHIFTYVRGNCDTGNCLRPQLPKFYSFMVQVLVPSWECKS